MRTLQPTAPECDAFISTFLYTNRWLRSSPQCEHDDCRHQHGYAEREERGP